MITPKLSSEKAEPAHSGDHSPTLPGGQHTRNLRLRGPMGFLIFGIFLVAVFIKPLFSLATGAIQSQLDSYIVLVPVVSAYLIYDRRKRLPTGDGCSPWAIIGPLIAAFAALATALGLRRTGGSLSNHDYLALMALSFVCFLAAGGFFFLGRKWMTAAAFPFAFLIFIVPMPDAMADTLETASAVASAEAASFFFNLTSTPTLRDGTVFQLPNITIQVGQECSGIRSSWVLFITSLLAANLFLKSGWRRAVLVCFVIPLGVARNGLRVAVIGNLCVHIGPQMINSIIHRRGGPLFFTLSLIPLFLLLWWLHRSEATGSQRPASGPASGSEEPTARREGPTLRPARPTGWKRPGGKTEFGGQRREGRGER